MSEALARMESLEDHVEAWRRLDQGVEDAAWSKASIAASVSGRYGEVAEFAAKVNVTERMVEYLAATFNVFPDPRKRFRDLSFTHHLRAAVLAVGPQSATEALARAQKEGWSERALSRYLRPPPPQTEEPEGSEEDGSVCIAPGACGPITQSDRAVHIWAFVENFHAVKDYDVRDLIRKSTKKSVRELGKKIGRIQEWFTQLQAVIQEEGK